MQPIKSVILAISIIDIFQYVFKLKGYDGHLIIREAFNIINMLGDYTQISAIPNSNEKFLSFSTGNMKFIDSFAFLSEKLEKLVANLYDDKG